MNAKEFLLALCLIAIFAFNEVYGSPEAEAEPEANPDADPAAHLGGVLTDLVNRALG
uniref:Venom peptide n=1 Tax=Dasymutilla sicheliana TaxID=1175388 RepID=A0A8T9VRP0_DASSI|nr:venom peptide precursor [Dasymutilla sicheliana]